MQFQSLLAGALAITLGIPATSSTATAQAATYRYLYVFGDSLSDNGNLFRLIGEPGEPYWMGRFSNGKVGAEQLAEALGICRNKLRDFALGGATSSEVHSRQVEPALAAVSGRLPSDTICLHWAGANDLLGLLANPNGDPALVIGNAMQQTAAAITALVFAGAKKIMVVNMPDLSKTPRVIALNDPLTSAGAQALAQGYNQALAFTIQQLEAAFHIDIALFDSFALINDIVADPRRRMIRVVDRPILGADGKTRHQAAHFLFFDDIHPTFVGHREIMRGMLLALGMAIPGDVNEDGVVNKVDLKTLVKSFGRCGASCPADMNDDGRVDKKDKKLLKKLLHKH